MIKYEYCPECNIGLSRREVEMRFCQNCKHNWDDENEDDMYGEDYEDNHRLADEEVNYFDDW